jgi:hypothetical protein
MAETNQGVSWAVERKCTLRNGEAWFLPDRTRKQLADIHMVAMARDNGSVVDGICVIRKKRGRDDSGNPHDIPYLGFSVEERLGAIGGFESVLATCGSCEANISRAFGISVAGCFGGLYLRPDSDELDRQLWHIIEQRKLEQRLRLAFTVTKPLWYGFWINSPLGREQSEFLRELLCAVCDEEHPRDEHLRYFTTALDAAIRWELPIHVSLAPPGHTDFGTYTIWDHCPRCKADAFLGRRRASLSEAGECEVCGHTFIPQEHRSREPFELSPEALQLRRQMGDTKYEQFVLTFLIQRGCSPEQAAEVLGKI